MITLLNGPAAGSYAGQRAPYFLRAVVNEAGDKDILDALDDTPGAGETVSVYRQFDYKGTVHINGTYFKGFVPSATYHHMPEVDGQELRETTAWRAWVADQPEAKDVGMVVQGDPQGCA